MVQYCFNIVFNILNKSALNVFPAPWFLATFQLCASATFMMAMWFTGIQKRPQVSKELIVALVPVAFWHTVGHVSACVAFSQVAVSFTHVVKSAEPVLSVILSQLLLKEAYPVYVWASLVPIVAGCSLAAVNEVSFAWSGFNNAMISNLGMVMRNIYSKKVRRLACVAVNIVMCICPPPCAEASFPHGHNVTDSAHSSRSILTSSSRSTASTFLLSSASSPSSLRSPWLSLWRASRAACTNGERWLMPPRRAWEGTLWYL